MAPPKMFKDQVFALSGKLSQGHKEYEELIVKHGGEVATSVSASVTFLISNEEDVKACSTKVATAQGRGTPILQEGFVGACIAAKKLLDPAFFTVKGCKRKLKKIPAISADGVSSAPAPAPAASASSASSVAGSSRVTPKRTSKGAEPPAKRARVTSASSPKPVTTIASIAVLPKSGLEGKAEVVQEEISKGFMKASLTWNVQLVLNDPATAKDKFYNMQLLAKPSSGEFWAVQQWGRTGLPGTGHVDGPFPKVEDAKRVFRRKYRQKTGNVWGSLGGTFVEVVGKYKLLAEDTAKHEAAGQWQYFMHNSVDGKKIGWYYYEGGDTSSNMEKFWRECQANSGLTIRFVHSDYFKYEVNFKDMIQTNTKSGTRRVIRRVPAGVRPSNEPPSVIPEAVKPRLPHPDDDEDDEDDEEMDVDDAECDEAEVDEAECEEAEDEEEGEVDEPEEPPCRSSRAPVEASTRSAMRLPAATAETLAAETLEMTTRETLPVRRGN